MIPDVLGTVAEAPDVDPPINNVVDWAVPPTSCGVRGAALGQDAPPTPLEPLFTRLDTGVVSVCPAIGVGSISGELSGKAYGDKAIAAMPHCPNIDSEGEARG